MKLNNRYMFGWICACGVLLTALSCQKEEKQWPVDNDPVILELSPEVASVGDVLTIKGDRFSEVLSDIEVHFDTASATVVSAGLKELQVMVPQIEAVTADVMVTVKGLPSTVRTVVLAHQPVIAEFVPETIRAGQQLVIRGQYFSPVAANNLVKIGGIPVDVVSATPAELTVIVPQRVESPAEVVVTVAGKTAEPITVDILPGAWIEAFDRPDVALTDASVIPSPIGAGWQIMEGNFGIRNEKLFGEAHWTNAHMLYRDQWLDLQVGNGNSFKLGCDIRVSEGGALPGVIFNVQSDGKRFYLVRLLDNGIQFLKTGAGGPEDWIMVVSAVDLPGFSVGNTYRVEISSATPGEIGVKLTNLDSGDALLNATVPDDNPYVGGSVGFYYYRMSNAEISFDNLSVELN
ncbi:IPT/TIG domain-containing protein [Parapedobacter defluvii]|nr:IPT/TIG domain-containing protein [Parapedobacter defluvii]